jgi:hypothetical protein
MDPSSSDYDECCVERDTCRNYRCGTGYFRKADADELYCAGSDCDSFDQDTCCEKLASCSDWFDHFDQITVCDETYVKNPEIYGEDPVYCTSNICDEGDVDTCCVKRESCASYACGEDLKKANPGSILCVGLDCDEDAASADHDTCCDKRALCSKWLEYNDVCPDEDEDGRKRLAKGTAKCKGTTCNDADDRDVCCGLRETCETFSCSDAWYVLRPAQVVKELYCAGEACDESDGSADHDLCCEPRATCESYACNTCDENTVDDIDACITGLVKRTNPGELYCKEATCDVDDNDDRATCCLATCASFNCDCR